jgi:hypothetical protein
VDGDDDAGAHAATICHRAHVIDWRHELPAMP